MSGSFDTVFLDAAKGDYLSYLKSIERFLHKVSVVVADYVKSHASEVKPHLDHVRRSGLCQRLQGCPAELGTAAADAVEISVRL